MGVGDAAPANEAAALVDAPIDIASNDAASGDATVSDGDGTVPGDAAACEGGSLSARVEGGAVQFDQCVVAMFGCIAPACSVTYYTYARIDCASPMFSLRMNGGGVGSWTGTLSFMLPGADGQTGQANAMGTIASLGTTGGFVDGTVSAPMTGLSGSFHACRHPDQQDVGH